MKLEQQVSSLELSKKLKALGVKQESLFWWCEFTKKNEINYTDRVITDNEYRTRIDGLQRGDGVEFHKHQVVNYVSAFTIAELGEMLPNHFTTKKFLDKWYCYLTEKSEDDEVEISDDTEADARAKMLIYLIENNLLKGA